MILEDVFLFGEKTKNPFGAKTETFPTKGVRTAHLEMTDALGGLMETIAALREDRQALMAFDRSAALHDLAHVFVRDYGARKTALGVLDFDDLIGKARDLLTDKAVAAWVLFRLDGGIDHLLVDEAQDTSPGQWAVVQHLTREFVSGEGARDTRRTVFVVGDKSSRSIRSKVPTRQSSTGCAIISIPHCAKSKTRCRPARWRIRSGPLPRSCALWTRRLWANGRPGWVTCHSISPLTRTCRGASICGR